MAVTSVTTLWDGRESSSTLEGGKSATVILQAITNSRADDHSVFFGDPRIPNLGQPHPNDPAIVCMEVSPRTMSEDGRVWEITLFYSNSESNVIDDPLIQPAVRVWSTETFQRAAIEDKDESGIVNTAGYAFDPPPQRSESRLTITITKNLPDVPIWFLTYADSVNSDVFTLDGLSFAARTAKVQRISLSDEKERNGQFFKTLELVLQFRRETWDFKILNLGRVELWNFGTEMNPIWYSDEILGKNNLPLPEPSLLDANGEKIDLSTLTNAAQRAAAATYVTYRVYDELNFGNTLPLT